MAADSQVPSRQEPTPEQEASQRKLLARVTAIVAAIVARELAKQNTKDIMVSAGISPAAITGAVTRALLHGSAVIHAAVRTYARMLLTDNTKAPTDQAAVEQLVAFENAYQQRYVDKAAERLVHSIALAVTSQLTGLKEQGLTYDKLDADQRMKFHNDVRKVFPIAVSSAIETEQRISQQRLDAIRQRVFEKVDEQRTQADSPEGGYWLLDPSKNSHTKDCIAMANHAWSWKVLSVISPSNRHYGCGCKLISLTIARAGALPNSDVVRTSAPAVALAGETR